MSSRKRKNPHNSDLPSAKRLKSNNHNINNSNNRNNKKDEDDNNEQSVPFPFEKAKACDKKVPLQTKKQRLQLKNREQSIKLKEKQKKIEMLKSQINDLSENYEYYHRLLISFSNTFDQIFTILQHKINPNDSIPLC